MTLWKTERAFSPPLSPPLAVRARARPLDWVALAVIGAAPALLLFWLLPLPLVLPMVSIVSFAVAGIVAIVAHHSGIDRRAAGVSAWDIAAMFTLIWIVAGTMSGAKQFVELFDRLATIP